QYLERPAFPSCAGGAGGAGRRRVLPLHVLDGGGCVRRSRRSLLRHFRPARGDAGALQRLRLLLPEAGRRDVLLRAAPLLFAIACERDAGNACVAVGDPRLAIELLPVTVNDAGALVPLHDGDGLLLQKPPQGGYVIYA